VSEPTILIAEDEPKTRGTIRLYLQHEGFDVLEEADGQKALQTARSRRPDLIVLDLMLPGLSGLDVCRTLRKESQVPIIMVTARAAETDKLKGLDLGADDYMTKPFSPRELVARVKAVLRRAASKGPASSGAEGRILTRGDLIIDLTRREVTRGARSITLTPAEFRLLEVLATSPGRVFSRDELVEQAFGYDYDGLDRTIDVHVKNLRRKIETDRTQPEYVLTVFGFGYKFAAVRGGPAASRAPGAVPRGEARDAVPRGEAPGSVPRGEAPDDQE
jgi:DNA-binding response OmpR family regulator